MLEYWLFLMYKPYGLLYLLHQQLLSVIDEPESKRLKDGLCLVHLVIGKLSFKLGLAKPHGDRAKSCIFQLVTYRHYTAVANHMFDVQNHNFLNFSRRLLVTTLMLLNAIAALATIGFRRNPQTGYNAPAAIGMPMTL